MKPSRCPAKEKKRGEAEINEEERKRKLEVEWPPMLTFFWFFEKGNNKELTARTSAPLL